MYIKSTTLSLTQQGIGQKIVEIFLNTAYNSVVSGVQNADKEFKGKPGLYGFRGIKSIWMTSNIKMVFKEKFSLSALFTKVKHMNSHGADYYVLNGKALICFKKMDSKSRVCGFYSKRFKDIMNGSAVHYSRQMLQQLQEMEILKPLPIYYIGHVLDTSGRLLDVRMVHYKDGKIAYEISLKQLCEENLFTIQSEAGDITVTPKKRNRRPNDIRKKAD